MEHDPPKLFRRRDVFSLLAATAATVPNLSACDEARSGANLGFPRTAEEIVASVTPVNLSFPPGSWRRYGADPSGEADSTLPIQQAIIASRVAFDDIGGTYRVTGTIYVGESKTICGVGGRTELLCDNPDSSIFLVNDVGDVFIERIRFSFSKASAKAYTAPVVFSGSSNCTCCDCEFAGCSWAGVWLHDARFCTVTRCHFHDFLGQVQDSADICIYNNSSDNFVTENRCFGGNDHGVLIENPYSNALPISNLVARNHIRGSRAYGVCLYVPDFGDTYNRILGNTIEDISGIGFDRCSGPGIYVAGLGAGGTLIEGNTIRRCCLETNNRTEAPGAIGMHGMSSGNAALTVANNVVDEIQSYDGILVAMSDAPIIIAGNTVRLLPGNVEGTPLRIEVSSRLRVHGNIFTRSDSEGRCVFVYANEGDISDVSISSNDCAGGNYCQIDFDGAGDGTLSKVVCSGNTCDAVTGNSLARCLSFRRTSGAIVSGNILRSGLSLAFYASDAKNFRIIGNSFGSGTEFAVWFDGNCENSFYAASNEAVGVVQVNGTGLLVESP